MVQAQYNTNNNTAAPAPGVTKRGPDAGVLRVALWCVGVNPALLAAAVAPRPWARGRSASTGGCCACAAVGVAVWGTGGGETSWSRITGVYGAALSGPALVHVYQNLIVLLSSDRAVHQ